jgi:hypothetical protein
MRANGRYYFIEAEPSYRTQTGTVSDVEVEPSYRAQTGTVSDVEAEPSYRAQIGTVSDVLTLLLVQTHIVSIQARTSSVQARHRLIQARAGSYWLAQRPTQHVIWIAPFGELFLLPAATFAADARLTDALWDVIGCLLIMSSQKYRFYQAVFYDSSFIEYLLQYAR